ncbi:MAG TPA: response regulator transcription factor [Chitinophagaceae bacterium]
MHKTTILIADDHTLVRETWSYILNNHPDFSVVGEAGSAEDAIELAKVLRPHVVIMDINLPGMNGIEATGLIRKFSPASKVLGVSLHTQPTYARKMIQKGAMGYVTKNSSREEMFAAINEVQQGKKYICQEIKNILSEQMIAGEESDGGINSLSARELEIIAHIKKGDSSKEIAEALNISVKTVEVHRYNILHKLKLKNTAALINFINQSQLELA